MHVSCRSFIAAAILACGILFAQHTHPQASGASPLKLPILVDGSKTPDQIPDELAYQHFVKAVAAHPSPSAQEQARQSAQLLPLQLSASDQQNLITTLAVFRTRLDQIELDAGQLLSAAPGPNTPAQLAGLKTQESALLTNTLSDLRLSLSPEGTNHLDQYVRTHVKAHVVICGMSH